LLIGVFFGTCFYFSISHFYYAQFWGGPFIGALVFIATYLFAYRGENRAEDWLATIAGFGAMGVALFPTNGRGCDLARFSGRALADFKLSENPIFVDVVPETTADPYFELFSTAHIFHFASAALLFAFLAYFSIFVFTRVIQAKHRDSAGRLKRQKLVRNTIYLISGGLILLSMAAMTLNALFGFDGWDDARLTFWSEAIALWAFGASWIVKGRFFNLLLLD